MKTITISKTYKFDKYKPDKDCIKLLEEILLRSICRSFLYGTKIHELFDVKIKNHEKQ